MSKWRLQFKEAEARLAELTGDKSGDVKRLVWGMGDEERFRGELDEKVCASQIVVDISLRTTRPTMWVLNGALQSVNLRWEWLLKCEHGGLVYILSFLSKKA